MLFKSKKDLLFTISILGINAFLIGIITYSLTYGALETTDYWGLLLILAVVGLLFWLFFGTNYTLLEHKLIYKTGPFNGNIQLSDITEIIKGKTLWVGLKPATSRHGLIIKYNNFDEIYISPKTNETFIAEILKHNSKIKITA